MDSIAAEYRRKVRSHSSVGIWVALAVATFLVGSLAIGVWFAQQDWKPGVLVILPDELRSRTSIVREATRRELRRRDVTAVMEDDEIIRMSDGSYLVSGGCMSKGKLTVYISHCQRVDGRWRAKVRLPLDEAFERINEMFTKAKQTTREAKR